ncbi:MAG: MFS transporter, partial [bacterium]|nr:MFS transporter [bacterium]
AHSVMHWVFLGCAIACFVLAVPRMDINSPGPGIIAKGSGEVNLVSDGKIVIDDKTFLLTARPAQLPAQMDDGSMVLPKIVTWQQPVVSVGDAVLKNQLLSEGHSNIYYPSNFWIFVFLVFIVGVLTGIGKAGLDKFIPDHFPNSVGAVGGMVGLLGAMGGFVLPPLFGYLLNLTGLWSSCWVVLFLVSIACLIWLHRVYNRILKEEVPDLVELVERRPVSLLPNHIPSLSEGRSVEAVLKHIPFFYELTEEELKELSHGGQYQTAVSGTQLFKEGDPGDSLYIIIQGSVRVYQTSPEGEQSKLTTLGAGEVFGELALIDGRPRSATVATLESCELMQIGRSEFLSIVTRSPRMLANLLSGLSGTIRERTQKFA